MNFSLHFEIPLKIASTISHQALSPAKPHNPDTLIQAAISSGTLRGPKAPFSIQGSQVS